MKTAPAKAQKPQHTPGPWECKRENESERAFRITGNKKVLADVLYRVTYDCAVSKKEAQANAHLMASAPDLLAACQFILAILEHPTKSVSDYDADKLRAAIARATQPAQP